MREGECPLWVISRSLTWSAAGPLSASRTDISNDKLAGRLYPTFSSLSASLPFHAGQLGKAPEASPADRREDENAAVAGCGQDATSLTAIPAVRSPVDQ